MHPRLLAYLLAYLLAFFLSFPLRCVVWFTRQVENIAALTATRGNVQFAIERIFSSRGF
jgi:hypothetical protein